MPCAFVLVWPIFVWQYEDRRTTGDAGATLGDNTGVGARMAVSTKKKKSRAKTHPSAKKNYYERTLVQPAARLIAAIADKRRAAKEAAAG
jgi:hypothetical protein